jgi:hypothetical protein
MFSRLQLLVADFKMREEGPTAVEYAVVLALIIVVCLLPVPLLVPIPTLRLRASVLL